ncbi:helix-turn-helix domain-containing protein [Flexithrix dorotheae]|uniref:helix-turn-helix domain-containing protein n=1 Tax=Flexithrix dorotheae TaxID=70993 RepID=UPI000378F38B|nr:helix-turn-helix transcriptional regulator [Flexithrix dorotheae]
MEVPIIYIGFAQAIFTVLIIFLKKPLKIADIILAVWVMAIVLMFCLNIIQKVYQIKEETWVFSLSIFMIFPPSLYLYSKYVTIEFNRFKRLDFLHFAPLFMTIILILLFRNPESTDFLSGIYYYNQIFWLRDSIGIVFNMMLWVYGVLALKNVIRFKKQIKNNYSFESSRISLTWLFVILISFMVLINLIIVVSTLKNTGIIHNDIDAIRDIALLVYVYIVSIWGYHQRPLISNSKAPDDSGKYQKSGLKSEQANEHLQKLILFMEKTEAWKDNELTVAKLSKQTQIPKHHITQVLNEILQKNFFTFVNEYRIEYAKTLIKSPKHQSWSFVAIAYECGFNSKTAFNNFFKKYTEMTPSEFRKR